MKIASIVEVKANLSAYVKAAAAELVVITRNGKLAAVLLPVEDDEELERLALAYSKRFRLSWPRDVTRSPLPGVSPTRTSGVRWGENVAPEAPPAASRHQTLQPNSGMLAPRKARSEGIGESS
jgi:prevent-host-death family protein